MDSFGVSNSGTKSPHSSEIRELMLYEIVLCEILENKNTNRIFQNLSWFSFSSHLKKLHSILRL